MLPLPPVWVCARPRPRARAGARLRRARPGRSQTRLADSLVADAAIALERGRPWQASRLIAVVLVGFDAPDARCGHARRHRGEPVGRVAGGDPPARWAAVGGHPPTTAEGRLLLARAALEQGSDSVALRHALAVAGLERRLPRMASASCFLPRRSSGWMPGTAPPRRYVRAAERLPSIADWLRIRAAAVTDDSARARAAVRAASPIRSRATGSAGARPPPTRAPATSTGAAARYAALGARATALRLRLASSPDSASRARSGGISRRSWPPAGARAKCAMRSRCSTAPSRRSRRPRSSRSAAPPATAGSHTRAVDGVRARLRRATRHRRRPLRLRHRAHPARPPRRCGAAVRARARRRASWPPPPRTSAPGPWSATASDAPGRTALARVLRLHPRDTTAASSALFLLGDLASDDRADARARGYYRQVVARYPEQPVRADGGLPRRDDRAARGRCAAPRPPSSTSLAQRYPRSDEAGAATYWAGRAWYAAGDTAAARARWELLAAGDPGSYYTGLAFRRLDRPAWTPAAAADSFVPIPGADSAMARAALLARLGLLARIALGVRPAGPAERHLVGAPARAGRTRSGADGLAVAGHPARAPRAGAGRAARCPHLSPALSGRARGRAPRRGARPRARRRPSSRRSSGRSRCSIPRRPRPSAPAA